MVRYVFATARYLLPALAMPDVYWPDLLMPGIIIPGSSDEEGRFLVQRVCNSLGLRMSPLDCSSPGDVAWIAGKVKAWADKLPTSCCDHALVVGDAEWILGVERGLASCRPLRLTAVRAAMLPVNLESIQRALQINGASFAANTRRVLEELRKAQYHPFGEIKISLNG